jgi:ribonuclease BN (tRNA processing enzyme)
MQLADQPPSWISGHEVAARADVLLHDAQYGDDEYPDHVGWGHSSIEHVMGFAHKADVGMTVLFHHDPYHTDDELEALLIDAQRQCETVGDDVCLAHEGMTIALDRAGVRFG